MMRVASPALDSAFRCVRRPCRGSVFRASVRSMGYEGRSGRQAPKKSGRVSSSRFSGGEPQIASVTTNSPTNPIIAHTFGYNWDSIST